MYVPGSESPPPPHGHGSPLPPVGMGPVGNFLSTLMVSPLPPVDMVV